MNTDEDLEEAPISFMVSKYWVMRTMSRTSLAVVPGTFSENPSTLSLKPSTIAWRCLAIPTPERYLDSASPSALFICIIFSASAFSFAATLSLAAARIKLVQNEQLLAKACLVEMDSSPALISFIARLTWSSGSISTMSV